MAICGVTPGGPIEAKWGCYRCKDGMFPMTYMNSTKERCENVYVGNGHRRVYSAYMANVKIRES